MSSEAAILLIHLRHDTDLVLCQVPRRKGDLVLQHHTKKLRRGKGLVLWLGGDVVLQHALLRPDGPPEAVVQHELQHLVGKSYNSNLKRNSSSVVRRRMF